MKLPLIAPERLPIVVAWKSCEDALDRYLAGNAANAGPVADWYQDYVKHAKALGEGYFSYHDLSTGHGVPADYPEIPIEPGALPQLDDGTYWTGDNPTEDRF